MSTPDLVVFGEDWGAHPSSTQHLIRRLQPDHRILWINSLGLRRPRLSLNDLRRLISKGRAMLSTPTADRNAAITRRPDILNPAAIPLPGNPLARLFNRRVTGPRIRARCRDLGIHRPIVWTSLPTAVDLLGTLNERALVYYCGDDFSALAGVDHRPVSRLERQLAERADLILAASPTLAEKFPVGKTRVLPHGVDHSLFATPQSAATELPAQRPIAGFYGSLSDWINTELIAATARLLPDWEFLLIGRVDTDISPFAGIANIRLLGPRDHQQLPSYAQHWQASLLPFRDNAQIRACNPLKLREYLAAGQPVISTDFPALNGYRDLISVVQSPQSMAAALQKSLSRGHLESQLQRQRVAAENWDARARQVATMLAAL